MRRLLATALALLSLLAVAAAPAVLPDSIDETASTLEDGVARAGVGSVDASWHLGASGGQFAGTAPGVSPDHYDPHLHATRKVPADTLGTRVKARALVVEGRTATALP